MQAEMETDPILWLEALAAAIRAMPADAFWIIVTTLILIIAATLSLAALWLHTYWIMRDTPTVMVRSAMDGYSELAGQLEPLAPRGTMTAPISGQPCVWYRVRIQQLDLSLTGGLWMDLFMEEEQRPCVLRDDSGTCVVDTPMALEVFGRKRDRWTVNLPFRRKPLPPRLSGVEQQGVNVPLRFIEERLEAGAPGYAIGELRTIHVADSREPQAQQTIEAWTKWRTDYIGDLRGPPEQLAPNPTTYSLDADVRRRAIPGYAKACGIRGKRVPTLGPSDSLRHPFVVAGVSPRLLRRRLHRRIGLSAAVIAIAGAPLILLLLARFGQIG